MPFTRRPPRGFVWLTVLLAVLLVLPNLFGDLIADDHLQLAMVRDGTRAPWDLFHFWHKDRGALLSQIRTGEVPWIVAPEAKLAFVRPLVSITHWLEYRLYPDFHAAMHAHSVAWYAILILAVGRLYLSLGGRRFATVLALVLFAVSSSGAVAAAWVCCRNTLVATAFGAFALTAHHRHRNGRGGGVARITLFALALLSGETSAGSLAFFLSYALFVDRAPRASRALSVLPYVALGAAFWGTELAVGYGVSAAGIYTPPGEGWMSLVRTLVERYLPMLSLEYGWGNLQLLGASELPSLPGMVALLGLWALAFVPAAARDRRLAFWLVGTLGALVPVSFALPQTRVLVAAHIGGAASIARLVELTLAPAGKLTLAPAGAKLTLARAGARGRRWPSKLVAALALLWAASGLVLGPLAMAAAPIITGRFADTEKMWARTLDAAPGQDAFVAGMHWLATPVSLATRRELGLPSPRSVTALTSAAFAEFERVDDRTLVVRAPSGILGPLGRSLRPLPFARGETIAGPRCRIEILEPGAHDPTLVRFTFDRPLEDPSFAWFFASPVGFVKVHPPPVGATYPVVNAGMLPTFGR
jgi:hypothetical protein